jgi:uncharacterized protein
MRNVLVDSGPLIALFDRSDNHHVRVKAFLRAFKGVLLTSWPVLTEVCHLLDFSAQCQLDFLRWVQRGGVTVEGLDHQALDEIIALMDKYHDRPMDLADASLLVLALRNGIRHIISVDSDFEIYRLSDKSRLKNLLKLT